MRMFCAIMILLPLKAFAGWDHGNAGDAFAAEFILSGRDVVRRLESLPEVAIEPANVRALRGVIEATEIISKERVFLDTYERDAVNYPSRGLIEISRARWRELRRSTETKARLTLVLHEYLWMTGVEDVNFNISGRLIEMLKIGNYSPNIWWNPVNPVNFITLTPRHAGGTCTMSPARFNIIQTEEAVDLGTEGDCGDFSRRVRIVKSAGVTPPSSNIRGLFHRFRITVSDGSGRLLAELDYEPEWGKCLVPEDGSCQVSGKLILAEVELSFWFLRN